MANKIVFPKDFLWGSATASYQIEGAWDKHGWEVRSTAEAFVEYTDVITRALGDRVKNWATHNESSVVAWLGYETGVHAPG